MPFAPSPSKPADLSFAPLSRGFLFLLYQPKPSQKERIITDMLSNSERRFLEIFQQHPYPTLLGMELDDGDNGKLLRKLVSEGYIEEFETPQIVGGGTILMYRLSAKGYGQFKPWLQKAWAFFTDDLAKILSVIATALSIVAIIVSLTGKK